MVEKNVTCNQHFFHSIYLQLFANQFFCNYFIISSQPASNNGSCSMVICWNPTRTTLWKDFNNSCCAPILIGQLKIIPIHTNKTAPLLLHFWNTFLFLIGILAVRTFILHTWESTALSTPKPITLHSLMNGNTKLQQNYLQHSCTPLNHHSHTLPPSHSHNRAITTMGIVTCGNRTYED